MNLFNKGTDRIRLIDYNAWVRSLSFLLREDVTKWLNRHAMPFVGVQVVSKSQLLERDSDSMYSVNGVKLWEFQKMIIVKLHKNNSMISMPMFQWLFSKMLPSSSRSLILGKSRSQHIWPCTKRRLSY